MLFSSYIFLIAFLPATLMGFYTLRSLGHRNASITFLLCASFVFYANWNISHFALLIVSIAINFLNGRLVAEARGQTLRKTALIMGITFNLSLIFWFKYFDFAASNVAALTGTSHTFYNLILPLGISFFTFQQISYLVDCYKAGSYEKRARDYALFVSFFPQLIAGPIVHHGYTRPQFNKLASNKLNLDMLPIGVMIFAMGLAKKTLIADPISRGIDPIWAQAAMGEPISAALSWTAMIGYSLQIYFDFSGYCDMAIGIAAMFGIRLPVNFNSPYKSRSIIEFWHRWHITLSNFLRDYVYIPLGGNRGGEIFRLRNIFLTMLIGGIWHGAAWTFVIWGVMHAALIIINHALRLWAPVFSNWHTPSATFIKRTATLFFVMVAWVFFRAADIGAANSVLSGLTTFSSDAAGTNAINPALFAVMAFGTILALFAPNSLDVAGYAEDLKKEFPRAGSPSIKILQPTPLSACATAIMLTGGLLVAWKPAVFIYYIF